MVVISSESKFATQARIIGGGNTKLGDTIGTFSKLMGDEEYYIPELGMTVEGSCGKFCKGCSKDCYVRKSYYRWTDRETGECSVKLGHAKNTLALREDIETAFKQLDLQLSRKRKPWLYVRWDQSGEYMSEQECRLHADLFDRHQESNTYVYTKAFEYVTPVLLEGAVPDNMTTLFSIWHEYGIEEFKKVQHLPNVKAFVYCDKNRDSENGWGPEEYAQHGIIIQTFCAAYDTKGKMNHDLTCDVCQKCMNRAAGCKIIGCWSH